MSKSANMLRTRRRDNNLKPNRRLDRKSSRGMLYENEELRLKTMNINAEVERGQSDIKKLKRENDQLRREIWYLRDEYEKLDKLLRDKEDSSSSTSCTSDSESCSSCTDASEEVETSQNLENVQKTNLKKFHTEFDHLSVVPEENSTENSDKNSLNQTSTFQDSWNFGQEHDIIKPDQSYPIYDNVYKASTLPAQEKMTKHFFSPIPISKSFEDCTNNQFMDTETQLSSFPQYPQQKTRLYNPYQEQLATEAATTSKYNPFGQNYGHLSTPNENICFPSNINITGMNKTTTDLIVKTDNRNFNTINSHSSFSNGGNLEELLNDIETISQDILKISHAQIPNANQPTDLIEENTNYNIQYSPSAFVQNNYGSEAEKHNLEMSFGAPFDKLLSENPHDNNGYLTNSKTDNSEFPTNNLPQHIHPDGAYKSELSVVLMPTPMPLIAVDKYKNIQRSCDSLHSRSIENLSTSYQNLKITPDSTEQNIIIGPDNLYSTVAKAPHPPTPYPLTEKPHFVPVPPMCPSPPTIQQQTKSPFFYGNIQDNYQNNNYFNMHYTPDNFNNEEKQHGKSDTQRVSEGFNSKTNLIDTITSSEQISSENEENLKFKTSRTDAIEKSDSKGEQEKICDNKKNQNVKSPKLNIRRKVSIHFKGKKDKNSKIKSLENLSSIKPESKPKTPTQNKKYSLFDIKFSSDVKSDKKLSQKTSSQEPKTPTTDGNALEPKTTTSSDSKTSNADSKSSSCEQKPNEQKSKLIEQYEAKMPELKGAERKPRKSTSVSPDRKHVHMKDGKKCHKKHKRSDRIRNRRSTISTDRFHRERSFSVCTDRSNIFDHKFGMGPGFNMYDDITTSDRERTNSLSSCDTIKARKMSNISNFPMTGKIPWCGCWGNGCL